MAENSTATEEKAPPPTATKKNTDTEPPTTTPPPPNKHRNANRKADSRKPRIEKEDSREEIANVDVKERCKS